MTPSVHLLESEPGTPVERLLDAFGVEFDRRPLAETLGVAAPSSSVGVAILSEAELTRSTGANGNRRFNLKAVASRYRNILIYPFRGTVDGLGALNECLGGTGEIASLSSGDASQYRVDADFPAAGPFAGLELDAWNATTDRLLLIRNSPYPIDRLISIENRALFTRITLAETEMFVISSSAVFDVDAEMVKNLDVKRCFSALVPLLMFLRHARAIFWKGSYPAANVIIDDLNLRPSYGFVNADTLAEHVDALRYAVSIAFIPWNCNRTSRRVTDLFRSRAPHLSVCIHGCDHIGAEFAAPSLSATLPMIAQSLDRMNSFRAQTGVGYDRVMVFPQGKFSANAMEALRQSDFLATVNTELIDDRTRRGVRALELLKPAITSYGGFPLFLRRKATEPIANFALDLLLGKPCLIVTHHDDFQRGMQPFASLVESLNALSPALRWTNLETIVSRTYSVRRNASDDIHVRLFSPMTVLEPQDGVTDVCFSKAEPLPNKDFEVYVAGEPVKVQRHGGDIMFRHGIASAEPTVVEVRMSPAEAAPLPSHPLIYRTKVATRRYLSEIRDNYVARSPWAAAAVRSARQMLQGPPQGRGSGRWSS